MHLRIEPNCGIPLGIQIVRQIRLAIAARRLAPGERLPSARDLSAQLQVNFHTVRKAFGELERAGLVQFERGKGTYVVEEAPALGARDLRELVREHVQRLAEDLAGMEVDSAKLESVVQEELGKLMQVRGVKS